MRFTDIGLALPGSARACRRRRPRPGSRTSWSPWHRGYPLATRWHGRRVAAREQPYIQSAFAIGRRTGRSWRGTSCRRSPRRCCRRTLESPTRSDRLEPQLSRLGRSRPSRSGVRCSPRRSAEPDAWWASVFPGIAIVLACWRSTSSGRPPRRARPEEQLMSDETLLSIRDLVIEFGGRTGPRVDGVSLEIAPAKRRACRRIRSARASPR